MYIMGSSLDGQMARGYIMVKKCWIFFGGLLVLKHRPNIQELCLNSEMNSGKDSRVENSNMFILYLEGESSEAGGPVCS
jgi:hypothetical protein